MIRTCANHEHCDPTRGEQICWLLKGWWWHRGLRLNNHWTLKLWSTFASSYLGIPKSNLLNFMFVFMFHCWSSINVRNDAVILDIESFKTTRLTSYFDSSLSSKDWRRFGGTFVGQTHPAGDKQAWVAQNEIDKVASGGPSVAAAIHWDNQSINQSIWIPINQWINQPTFHWEFVLYFYQLYVHSCKIWLYSMARDHHFIFPIWSMDVNGSIQKNVIPNSNVVIVSQILCSSNGIIYLSMWHDPAAWKSRHVISGYIGIYQNISGYIRIYRIYRDISGYDISGYISWYIRIYQDISGCHDGFRWVSLRKNRIRHTSSTSPINLEPTWMNFSSNTLLRWIKYNSNGVDPWKWNARFQIYIQ